MSNRSVRENLNLLIQTKEELKSAINIQGGTIDASTSFDEYANQIGDISFGPDINWAQIGFKQKPDEISKGYEYARYMVDHVNEFPGLGTNKLDVSANSSIIYLPSCSKLGVNPNNITSLSFYNCFNLVQIEDKVLNTKNIRYFKRQTFENCINLKYIPKLDISTYSDFGDDGQGLFKNLYSLETVDPSNDTALWYTTTFSMGFKNLFAGCHNLKTLPVINCEKLPEGCRKLEAMFSECKSLTDVSIINTSTITHMSNLFSGCTSLITAPWLDTQNVSTMNGMFNGCKSLTTVPLYNTQNVTTMSQMFRYCTSLTTVPQFDTQNVTNMSYMFSNCTSLTTIEGLDFKSISSLTNGRLVGTSSNSSIRKMYIKNIGYSACPSYDFSYTPNWGVNNTAIPDASLSIYKSLVEDTSNRAAAGSSTVDINLHSNSLNSLDNTAKAAICAKGYTLNGTSY